MSVIGNPLTLGGGKESVVAFAMGREAYSDWDSAQGIYGGWRWVDNKCFEYAESDNSKFICLKAGVYNVYYFLKGGYNTSGSSVNVIGRVYKNDSVIDETTTTSAGTGSYSSVTNVQVAVNDIIHYRQRNSSGITGQTGMVVITKADIAPSPEIPP